MRAINLIPAEEQRGAGGVAGRSGGAAYVLVGVLVVLVALVSLLTLQKGTLSDKQSALVVVEAQAVASERRAGDLAAFTRFAGLRDARVQTVTSLAGSRFDWSHALGEVARTIPANVWLTGLQGTVAPGVALKTSAATQTSTLRGALPVPAIEMVGCTTDQRSVAGLLTRMRLIDGVTRVSLQSSVEGEQESDGGGGTGEDDCRRGRARFPQFGLVVFFDRGAGAVPTTTAASRRVSASTLSPTAVPTAGATP